MKIFILLIPLVFQVYASEKILNGTNTQGKEHENVVALVTDGNKITCTATLIDPHLVMTAAHCLELVPTKSMHIYVGHGVNTGILPVETKLYRVKEGWMYGKSWNEVFKNVDTAILLLEDEIRDVEPVKLIKDAHTLDYLMKQSTQTIVGFGYSDNVQSGPRGVKRQGQAKLYSVLDSFGKIQIGKIRAGETSAAHGDSGGPSFGNDKDGSLIQTGITSYGEGDSVYYGQYHRFLCWMESKTGINLQHQFDCKDLKQQAPIDYEGLNFKFENPVLESDNEKLCQKFAARGSEYVGYWEKNGNRQPMKLFMNCTMNVVRGDFLIESLHQGKVKRVEFSSTDNTAKIILESDSGLVLKTQAQFSDDFRILKGNFIEENDGAWELKRVEE